MTHDQMRVVEPPLLKTKITIPPLPVGYVARPRLTEMIERGAQGQVTLVCAPAGYGKTNLLIEWARNTRSRVAWLTLDSADNDQDRMFRYAIAALQTLEPHLGDEALDFIQSVKGSGTYTSDAVEIGLAQLVNELSVIPGEMVLIMDDIQAIDDPVKLQSTSYFLKNMPPSLHIIFASRSEPALDLAYLRGKGHLTEIGADDLRFTVEEVGKFFQKAIGVNLPQDTIQILEERTDGWVAALQMASLSLRRHPDPMPLLTSLKGDVHYLVAFLAEEVLNRQPEELRQFLLKSSILDTLNGPLCEAVVDPDIQPGYGNAILNRLEHDRLFITALDEQHELFRYHNLFAEFLRHVLTEVNPSDIPLLHKRAALWFEKNEKMEEAFKHALACGDDEWAADLIQRNLETMINTGAILSLTNWIGQLPDSVIHRRPALGLNHAWGLIATYHLDLARYWMDDVRRRLQELEDQPNSEETETALMDIHGGLAICQSMLALLSGDMEQAAELSRVATQYLKDENPFIQCLLALDRSMYLILAGDTATAIASLQNTAWIARQANHLLVRILATCQLADMQALQGRLSQAWITLQKAQLMAIGPKGKPLQLTGFVDVGLGEILLERNSLEEANDYLERGMKVSETMWLFRNLDSMVSLARLRQIQGEISGSQAVIEKAMRLALNTETNKWDETLVSAIAVRLALQREDLPDAQQWWGRGNFPDFTYTIPIADYPYHIYEYLVMTQVRLLIAMGRSQNNASYLQKCVDLLTSLEQEAERLQRFATVIEIRVSQAIVQHSLGNTQQAVTRLLSALAMGEHEGYQRVYLDGGKPIEELLVYCHAEPQEADSPLPSSAFLEKLQSAFHEDVRSESQPLQENHVTLETFTVKTEDGFPITLSAREVEVLKLISEGKSNQEISAELYLALNTVKRHAYNIYGKLGVQKRTQAVSIARKLGLIP